MLAESRTIYLISGPLGVGKSSLSKVISLNLGCALVEGDVFFNPLENDEKLSWEDRLKLSWNWIVNKTKEYLKNDRDVVIDFVVEDELSWFIDKVSGFNVQIKYVVLLADRKSIIKRLRKRDGGTQYLERSVILLNQLQSDTKNSPFILDTTGKSTEKVFEEFIEDERFLIRLVD